jgi:hypothetical protein
MRLRPSEWSKTVALRVAVLSLVVVLLVPAGTAAITNEPQTMEAGSISEPANGTTIISVQGFKLSGEASGKKPARLVGVGPTGEVRWVENGESLGVTWFYDVDPINGSNLLVTGVNPSETVISEWNPQTGEVLWSEQFALEDTHDVDAINGDQLLIANMRNYNESSGKNEDRILVYNRTTDQIVWEWQFRDHYPADGGGTYTDDWTHVNDVDKVAPGEYLVSNRNFDQTIIVNRSTDEIDLRLGSDGDHETLYEQHNPQYLRGANDTETVLVADSENDRIVEYAKTDGTWNRTWTLGSSETLNWPRDADRLPNGNTLVTDTLNHRVMEVTPEGEIVWEFYAPWGTYDAERVRLGDEPGGPTVREMNASGTYELNGSAGLTPGAGSGQTFSQWVSGLARGTPLEEAVTSAAERYAHVTPWVRPIWMDSWAFASTLFAGLVTIGWVLGELVYQRIRIRAAIVGAIKG